MSRPGLKRALRRAGLAAAEAGSSRPRGSRGAPPPPLVRLEGETDDSGSLDFAAVFGRRAPVEIEIGSGKGRFLLEEAATHPDRDYLGVELELEYVLISRARAERAGLGNVRFERLDGRAFVRDRLAPGSVAALHVYFPDPWPKKRHHKRRLFDAPFAAAAARALKALAPLRVASDHPDYFQTIVSTLSAEPALELVPDAETGPWTAGTNYELKFVAAGRPIGRAVFRRRVPD